MRKILELAGQLGVDTSLGVLTYVVISLAFEQDFALAPFLATLAAAHSPDFDLIPYALGRRLMGLDSHRLLGHQPTIFLPLVILGIGLCFDVDRYLLTLVGVAIFMHFVHDSMEPHGLHWGWPVTLWSVSIHGGWPHLVPPEKVREALRNLGQEIKKEGEVFARVAPLNPAEAVILVAGPVTLLLFLLL